MLNFIKLIYWQLGYTMHNCTLYKFILQTFRWCKGEEDQVNNGIFINNKM